MKSWSRLCFLVLAISSISRGQDAPTPPPGDGMKDPEVPPTQPLSQAESQNQTTGTTPPSSSPQSHASAKATDQSTSVFTTEAAETSGTDGLVETTTVEVNGSAAAQTTGGRHNVPTATSTSSTPEAGSSWAYVILVLIILVIIALCLILYCLRRVSRTYTFDLHRPAPANHLNEPIGTFEPVYLDDLAQPSSKGQVTTGDLSPPPVSNGTTLPSEERRSDGESATPEQPEANGTETSPTSNTGNNSPSLGDGPADRPPSSISSTNMFFFNAVEEEQQNENNNNPSVCSRDPFVEINLDEAALCDQLLTSPKASSVLPFSPFSFSSSSSSSSSSLHLQ